MKGETADKILAEISERIKICEGKSELADTKNEHYVEAYFDGQVFALAFVHETIKAYRRGEKE
jgi:hypothetical protein